jgi:peptidoglycan/LPS O-acetylase OafA/YrhL
MSIFQPGNYTGLAWASWTLSIELTFYLLFPFIFRICSTFKRSWFLLLFSIFADLAYVELKTAGLPDPLHSGISANAPNLSFLIENQIRFGFLHNFQFFILGIVFFHVYCNIVPSSSRLPRILAIYTGVVGFFALVIFYPASIYSVWHGRHTLLAIFLLIFVVGVSWYPTRLFVNRLTVFLGTISYSLYLLHPSLVAFLSPLYAKLYKLNWHPDLSYALCLVTTLMILVPLSIVTYKLIEVPGIKLGNKIIRSMSP